MSILSENCVDCGDGVNGSIICMKCQRNLCESCLNFSNWIDLQTDKESGKSIKRPVILKLCKKCFEVSKLASYMTQSPTSVWFGGEKLWEK